jgi:AraC-like DNA-binding protein
MFEAHDIRGELDSTGRYGMRFPGEFQLSIRLFNYRSGRFTRGDTWHEQLELFCPISGSVDVQMGSQRVSLAGGDFLVVDNLKLHHVVDRPGLDAQVAVVSFLPEFVYTLGSSSHDFAFLLPFFTQSESALNVLRASEPLAGDAHAALAALLETYFSEREQPHWEAACKARLLALLMIVLRRFQRAGVLQWEFDRRRTLTRRFAKLLNYLQSPARKKLPLREAARMCGMSTAQFTRSFRQASGMSYLAYVTHLRVSEAARLLRAPEKSIAEIADATGFADQSHLDRQFKRAFGTTPLQYRKSALE